MNFSLMLYAFILSIILIIFEAKHAKQSKNSELWHINDDLKIICNMRYYCY